MTGPMIDLHFACNLGWLLIDPGSGLLVDSYYYTGNLTGLLLDFADSLNSEMVTDLDFAGSLSGLLVGPYFSGRSILFW